MRHAELAEMSRRGEIERDIGTTDNRNPTKQNSLDLTLTPPNGLKNGMPSWSEVKRVEELKEKFLDFQREQREQQARERLEKQLEHRQVEEKERELARQELERRLEEQRRRDAELERRRQEQMREIYRDRER